MKRFINTVIEEFGKEKGRDIFIEDFMERLDSLAKKHSKDEIFHLAAGECIGYDDNNKPFGVIEFLEELDISSVEDKALQETLIFLKAELDENEDNSADELLGELYDRFAWER